MTSDHTRPAVEATIDVPRPDGTAPTMVASAYRFGCWLIIEADGEVDIAGVPLLRRLLDDDSSHVVFDLRRVTFIDACGLGLLAKTQQRVSRAHGAVRVACPSQQARKLLKLTTLDQHITVVESLSQAFAGHDWCW